MTISQLVLLVLHMTCMKLTLGSDTNSAIPLSYIRRSGMIEAQKNRNLEQFFNSLGRRETRTSPTIPGRQRMSLMRVASVDRMESVVPEPATRNGIQLGQAGCDLYDTIVPIPNDRADVIVYPSCVVVKHCAGCCGHPSLECRPVSHQALSVEVAKYIYNMNSGSLEFLRSDVVDVQQHTSCECQCKVQESHCNRAIQDYDSGECRCLCRNHHESTSCPQHKNWDADTCSCRCPSVLSCSSGYRFNTDTCSCEAEIGHFDIGDCYGRRRWQNPWCNRRPMFI